MSPKKRANGLPPYVYKRSRSYVLREYLGKGEPMRSIALCSITAPISEVWKQYELQRRRLIKNLHWLLDQYQTSPQYKKLSPTTQKDRRDMIERICDYKMKSGKPFGQAEIKNITAGAIRKYLDAREQDGSPVAGNREVAIISSAYNWALERDIIKEANPCLVVRRNKESARTRYVTDKEYETAYNLAPPYIRAMMELAYLCRMRRGEILSARRDQILDEGFDTIRTKGSKSAITRWSERLKAAVDYDNGKVKSLYVIHDKNGQQIKVEKFKTAWTRLKAKMKNEGIEPFNFHDLKAAGVSNFEGDKLQASGHTNASMLKIYDRKKIEVDPTR